MLSKRAAVWLIALAASLAPAVRAQAQPANSNLQYQSPTPVYENGSAPYSDDTPEQGHGFSPFSPVHFEPDYEMFAPAETSGYGNGPRAKIGYFGSYERVFWSISKPATATIGSQSAEGFGPGPGGVVDQFNTNTADTGFLLANGAWGNRWELGYVDDDNYGWLVSILDHVSQAQYHVFNGAQVLFNDPGQLLSGFAPFVDPVTGATIDRDINNNHIFGRFGQDIGVANPNPPPSTIFFGNPTQPAPVDTGDLVPLVPSFYWLIAKNVTQINGTEVMRMYRAPRLHSGGFFELLYGVRWLQVNDTFLVMGIGGLLDNSTWSTRAQNNMVGPQLGARFWSQRGRWITSFEARRHGGCQLPERPSDFANCHAAGSEHRHAQHDAPVASGQPGQSDRLGQQRLCHHLFSGGRAAAERQLPGHAGRRPEGRIHGPRGRQRHAGQQPGRLQPGKTDQHRARRHPPGTVRQRYQRRG